MSIEIKVKLHEVKNDGLPIDENGDMPDELIGKVAFLWDGEIVSGWPLNNKGVNSVWEAADDALGGPGEFQGVTHWVEFPKPIWDIEDKCTCHVCELIGKIKSLEEKATEEESVALNEMWNRMEAAETELEVQELKEKGEWPEHDTDNI